MSNITLVSADGTEFEAPLNKIRYSGLVKEIIEEDEDCEESIPLPNVHDKELKYILEYCDFHVVDESSSEKENENKMDVDEEKKDEEKKDEEKKEKKDEEKNERLNEANPIKCPLESNDIKEIVPKWYSDFILRVSNGDDNNVIELMKAANYMQVHTLIELCCAYTATQIKGRSPEEIRKHFKIEDDFTEEEKAAFAKEYQGFKESD